MAQDETTLIHTFRKNALEQVHLSLRRHLGPAGAVRAGGRERTNVGGKEGGTLW